MKANRLFSVLAFAASIASGAQLFAQTQPAAGTGSNQLDQDVASLDQGTASDSKALLARLSSRFGVTQAQIDSLATEGYKPGEIWLALELSQVTGKSLDEVVALAQGQEGHGWGLVAKSLGIAPGSRDFLALVGKANADAQGMRGKEGSAGKSYASGSAEGERKGTATASAAGAGSAHGKR